jgi:hypothetical protein
MIGEWVRTAVRRSPTLNGFAIGQRPHKTRSDQRQPRVIAVNAWRNALRHWLPLDGISFPLFGFGALV